MKKFICLIMAAALLCGVFGISSASAVVAGDANGDGRVNAKDVLIIRKHIAKFPVSIDIEAADVVGDGRINASDVLQVRKFIAKLCPTLTLKMQPATSTAVPSAKPTTPGVTSSQPTTTAEKPTTTAKPTTIVTEPGWHVLSDFENGEVGTTPTQVTNIQSGTVTIGSIGEGANKLDPTSKKALAIESSSCYYSPKEGIIPTYIKLEQTLPANATGLRVSMDMLDKASGVAEVVNIGFRMSSRTYYTTIDTASYSKGFEYFYFVGKEYNILNKTEKYTLTAQDVPKITTLCPFVATSGTTTLYMDNVEFFIGEGGYDSSEYEAGLPKTPPINTGGVKKYMTISFDDGPSVANMGKILDVLEEYDAKATFFLLGNKVNAASSDVLRRAVALGCELGNHSYSHIYLTDASEDEIRKQLNDTSDLIYQHAGVRPTAYRPPYLAVNARLFEVADMLCIGGHCPLDYNGTSVDYRVEYIRTFCADDGIILLHDTQGNNAEVTRRVIEMFQPGGYEFVTITDAFEKKNINYVHNKMYNYVK